MIRPLLLAAATAGLILMVTWASAHDPDRYIGRIVLAALILGAVAGYATAEWTVTLGGNP